MYMSVPPSRYKSRRRKRDLEKYRKKITPRRDINDGRDAIRRQRNPKPVALAEEKEKMDDQIVKKSMDDESNMGGQLSSSTNVNRKLTMNWKRGEEGEQLTRMEEKEAVASSAQRFYPEWYAARDTEDRREREKTTPPMMT